MTIPSFLVIGAMKAGTTTLYEDLRQHPSIHLLPKEASILSGQTEGARTPTDALNRYTTLLSSVSDRRHLGDVSTTYAMKPHFPDVVDVAMKVLPSSTKIIYIVREPVARIISHHHHDTSSGRLTMSIDRAVREDPRLLDYTRYAMQVAPWITAFGMDQVLIVRFEHYMQRRADGLTDVLRFLGVPPLPRPADAAVHNASAGKPVATGSWRALVRSTAYRRLLRPLVPEKARRQIMGAVLPKAADRFSAPTSDTVAFIHQQLRDDQDEFAKIVGSYWWPGSAAQQNDAQSDGI